MSLATQNRQLVGYARMRRDGDREFNELVDQHNQLVDFVRNVPFLQGTLLSDQTLTGAADNFLVHGLGRPFKGVIPYGQSNNAAGITYTHYTATSYDNTQKVNIRPAAAFTGQIWVF